MRRDRIFAMQARRENMTVKAQRMNGFWTTILRTRRRFAARRRRLSVAT